MALTQVTLWSHNKGSTFHMRLLKRKIVLKFTIENCIKLYGAKHPTPVPLNSSINIEEVADKCLEAEHLKKDKARKKYNLRPRINK